MMRSSVSSSRRHRFGEYNDGQYLAAFRYLIGIAKSAGEARASASTNR